MAKHPQRPFHSRIPRMKAIRTVLIGYVEAPDVDQANRIAIREFGIINPERQKVVAQRVDLGRE
jgi:hypothetical protein